MADKKEHINLVFIGHVDHGKSTTVGRLMFDSGNLSEQQLRKLREKAESLGKAGFEFAYAMDGLKEEQERGVTIDLAHKKFESEKYYFTIIDAPGHRDFVKNMITGASQADAGVLVVAANDGVNSQTKEHVFLSRTLGVQQMIVAVNKMDLQDYSEDRFKAVKEEVSTLLKNVGYKTDNISFIPLASLKGDNVYNKSENMPWYEGKTLYQEIDSFDVPEKPVDLPLRMPVQDVYNITGIGVVPVGRIETGVMKLGDKLVAMPGREGNGVRGECKTIEMHHEQQKEAYPGDNVGISVRGFGKKDLARGDVIGKEDNIPTVIKEFTGQIVILNHPSVITAGYTPVFHIHTSQVACQFVEILKRVSPEPADKPDFLKNGDAGVVKIRPTTPLVLEKKEEIPQMANFAIRDSGKTVAAGMCIDNVKKD
ncbi:MAG: translation elongation factor EF-1 subunit alpha [Nanobdellota archaeon]